MPKGLLNLNGKKNRNFHIVKNVEARARIIFCRFFIFNILPIK